MDFSGWSRHQLRAQGRTDRRPQQALLEFPLSESNSRSAKKDSISKTNQLLDFLAHTAAQTEKALLKPTAVPEFARVKSFTGNISDINALLAAKRQERRSAGSQMPVLNQTDQPPEKNHPESLFLRLAQTLEEATVSDVIEEESTAPASRASVAAAEMAYDADLFAVDLTVEGAHAWLEGDFVEDNEVDESAIIMLERAYVADLDRWFSARSDDDENYDEPDLSQSTRAIERTGSLPRVLPPTLPNPYEDSGDETFDALESEESAAPAPVKEERHRQPVARRKYSRSLYAKAAPSKPTITSLPNGTRLEKFPSGATLAKDALGRVTEVHSTSGGLISIQYDQEGQPETFVRCDARGRAHSLGERDKHGVVVRDPEGRVRAAGESMAVDPNGCLSVRRFDGQFWSLDLIRGLHIERRRLCDREGSWHSLTAVFAFDGFRMMTRFQRLEEPEGGTLPKFVEPSGRFRFYGRDGSVVQFECEDELVELKPSQVWPPASRRVEPVWRKQLQGGTAWQSVQEYVTSYLLA